MKSAHNEVRIRLARKLFRAPDTKPAGQLTTPRRIWGEVGVVWGRVGYWAVFSGAWGISLMSNIFYIYIKFYSLIYVMLQTWRIEV